MTMYFVKGIGAPHDFGIRLPINFSGTIANFILNRLLHIYMHASDVSGTVAFDSMF